MKCFGDLEAPPKGPAAPRPAPTRPAPALGVPAALNRGRERRHHDGAKTCLEARIAIPSVEDAEEIPTPRRRFTVWETTSGLPDDSREADEKEAERQLRDLRGRVKATRAVVAGTAGLAETLASDWKRAAAFYDRFGVTEEMVRNGVPDLGSSVRT